MARKDTASYRASKFVLRHKAGITAAVAVVLTVVAGFVITVREARIAQQRFDDARSLANSLIFDVHDSIKDLPGSTPAKKIIVDRALRYLNELARRQTAMSDCNGNWHRGTSGSDQCKAIIWRITSVTLKAHLIVRRRSKFASR